MAMNIGARYDTVPMRSNSNTSAPAAPTGADGDTTNLSSEVSASILRKAIDSAASETAGLLATLPEPQAVLPPIGNVGRHFDSRF